MKDKSHVKTIRFTASEVKKIQLFLEQNPGLDFSTLIRLSVGKFITAPTLNSLDKNTEQTDNASTKETLWS